MMDDLFATARDTLDVVRNLCHRADLHYGDLPDAPVGVGLALAWSDGDYCVLGVMGGGNEQQVMISSGVLQNLAADLDALFAACNNLTRENSAYPTFLHDAPAGKDILVQRTESIAWLIESPKFFATIVRTVSMAANHRREQLAELGIGGAPYRYCDADLDRLLVRSML